MADDITKDLDDLYLKAKGAKKLFIPEWAMNLSYFENRQWLKWTGRQLQEPQLSPNRITVVENRITGCVQTELAKMTKNRPVFTVTPNTGDEEDANAAELGERIMRYLWRHLKMHELALKALEWSRVCGAGFLKCYWDNTIGDPVDVLIGPDGNVLTDPQSGKPMRGDQNAAMMIGQQLGAQVRSKRIAQGDIRVEVRSPFQMFIDPICDSFPEAEWVIEESVKSKEYVLKRFGQKIDPDTPANPGLVAGMLMGTTPTGATQGSDYKGVRVREYWCKPNSEHPNGCRIVWAKGKVLEQDERPFDPMPYVMLTGVPVPGRLWPMSLVELLRGPQTELNKVRSQMAENRNRIGNPTAWANINAIRDGEQFQDNVSTPGGVLYVDPSWGQGLPMGFLEPPQLPEYVANEPQNINGAIEAISGQHEVTNANVPPGVTAASAITLLQEADDTRLGLSIQDYEEQIGRFGSKLLHLVANFYTDSRTIKIAGDDGAWQIFDFRATDLKGNTTVEVQSGSALPQSNAAKQAALMDILRMMAQSGNPIQGDKMAQFLESYGVGGVDRLTEEYTRNETQVNRENSLMSLGTPMPLNSYDDDQAHITGHTDFQKAARYAQFSPQIKMLFEQHVQEHRQRLEQQQQQQLEMQLQMSGQVPPMLSNAAFQDAQQLSQLQGQQEMQGQAQQQGMQQAGAEQQQRHAELSLAQRQRMELEKHHQAMQHAEELHQAKLAQTKQQANRPQGAGNGR